MLLFLPFDALVLKPSLGREEVRRLIKGGGSKGESSCSPGIRLFGHEKASLASLQLSEQGRFLLSSAVLSSRRQREGKVVLALGGIGQSIQMPDQKPVRLLSCCFCLDGC